VFAPFHYLSRELHSGAKCFGLYADGVLAAFTGVLHFPHPSVRNIKRISRTVTLPDYQGLGLSFVLNDTLGAIHKTAGYRLRNYPAHPAFVRAHDRSTKWALCKRPGEFSPTATITRMSKCRPCAVFEYVGEAWPDADMVKKILT
jgi:hypothetical protein